MPGSHACIVVESAFNDLLEQLNGGFPYCLCIAFYLPLSARETEELEHMHHLLVSLSSHQVATREKSHFIQFL